MKQVMPLLFAFVLVAGCAPLNTYYKPGVSVAKLKSDGLDCRVAAEKEAPKKFVRVQGPPIYIPPRRYCDSAGNCETRGGYFEPGFIETTDVNRVLRNNLEAQCMARRGYTVEKIPVCSSSVKASGETTTLPKLSDKSCVIKKRDGRFLIVEPT